MLSHLYERSLGDHYLALAPAHLDDEQAALALIAHVPGSYYARIKHTRACRHLVLTGDDSQLKAYFAAMDIGPEHDFDAETVAAGRQEVERMRMLEWEMTGSHPADTDDEDDP